MILQALATGQYSVQYGVHCHPKADRRKLTTMPSQASQIG